MRITAAHVLTGVTGTARGVRLRVPRPPSDDPRRYLSRGRGAQHTSRRVASEAKGIVTPRQVRARKRRRFVTEARAEHGVADPEQREPLADARIRPLLERYVSAAGATLEEIADGLVELHVPVTDRRAFNKRSSMRIAFTLDAFEHDPDAEIAVVGSPLVGQLVEAIRSRGSRFHYGFLPPDVTPNDEAVAPGVSTSNVTLGAPQIALARHRIVSLLARIVVSAGSAGRSISSRAPASTRRQEPGCPIMSPRAVSKSADLRLRDVDRRSSG